MIWIHDARPERSRAGRRVRRRRSARRIHREECHGDVPQCLHLRCALRISGDVHPRAGEVEYVAAANSPMMERLPGSRTENDVVHRDALDADTKDGLPIAVADGFDAATLWRTVEGIDDGR